MKEGIFLKEYQRYPLGLHRCMLCCLTSRAHQRRVSFVQSAYRLHHIEDPGLHTSNIVNHNNKSKKVTITPCISFYKCILFSS